MHLYSTLGPLLCFDFLTVVMEGGISAFEFCSDGSHIVKEDSLRFFFQDFSMQTAEELDSSDPYDRTKLFYTIRDNFFEVLKQDCSPSC